MLSRAPFNIPEEHLRTWNRLHRALPNVKWDSVDWEGASLPSDEYNCLGFVVNDGQYWQPLNSGIPGYDRNKRNYWPPGVPGEYPPEGLLLKHALEALKTERYEEFDPAPGEPHDGYEVAVVMYKDDRFHHVCLLKRGDVWRSKCGDYSDFDHLLEEMMGGDYGEGLVFVRRRLALEPPLH